MSLTNPETVVTEQRLADFYQGILPYLGANASFTVMSKFNKSDLYSTDDQLVGRWTDGKPLYQKTITGLNVTPAYDVWTDVCVAPTNIESLTSVKLLTNANDDISGSGIEVALSNGKIRAEYLQNHTLRTIAIMTIQYTKTTDVSVNIGSDTDYSETEKIVGTWIDGKPLYQKTIDCGVMPNSTTKTVAHNISNIESIVSLTGVAKNNDNVSGFIPLPLTMVGSSTTYQIYMKATYTDIVFKSDSNMSEFSKSYVTLQYTKTTD